MATASPLESLVNNIKDCPICRERLTDPRALPCLHTFCLLCLEKHCKLKSSGDAVVCPLCRNEFQIPENGVKDLPKNFLVNELLMANDQNEAVQGDGDGDVVGQPASMSCNDEAGVDVELKSKLRCCEQHSSNQLEFYCTDCEINICSECSTDKHRKHDFREIDGFAEEFKQKMDHKIEFLSNLAASEKKGKQELDVTRQQWRDKLVDIETSIKQRAEEWKDLVDKAEESSLCDLEMVKTGTDTGICKQEERMERRLRELETFISHWQEKRDNGSPCDITMAAADLSRRADELMACAAATTSNNCFSTDASFVPADMQKMVTMFGGPSALIGQLSSGPGGVGQHPCSTGSSLEQQPVAETQSTDTANSESNDTPTLAETEDAPHSPAKATANTEAVIGNKGFGEEQIRGVAKQLRSQVWQMASFSFCLAAVFTSVRNPNVSHFPCLFLLVDIVLILYKWNTYLKAFLLNEKSLKKHADQMNTSADALNQIVNEAFPRKWNSIKFIVEFFRSCGWTSLVFAFANEVLRHVPGLRFVLAVPLAYVVAVLMFRSVITRMKSVAIEVARFSVKQASQEGAVCKDETR